MKLLNVLLAAGALTLVLGTPGGVYAKDPGTKVKVGKDGVSVDTGSTKVKVEGDSVDVETDEGEGAGEAAKPAGKGATVTESEGDELSLTGNDKKLSHVCGGPKKGATSIEITGNNLTVALKGPCKSVTITGNGHTVSVEEVGAIVATGNQINVTWKKGLAGRPPQITKTGNGVKVTKLEK